MAQDKRGTTLLRQFNRVKQRFFSSVANQQEAAASTCQCRVQMNSRDLPWVWPPQACFQHLIDERIDFLRIYVPLILCFTIH